MQMFSVKKIEMCADQCAEKLNRDYVFYPKIFSSFLIKNH